MTLSRADRMWLFGLVAGGVAMAVLVLVAPLGIVAIVVIALLPPRPAAAGGVSIAAGAAFLFEMWRAADRCAAFNRQSQAACTMGDNTPFAIVGVLLLVLGLALSAFAVTRSRTATS